ncbi:RsmF rRNA methyltransferase first C-terminal domain-containing protein [Eubacterium aggregans]|uniref:RsmF rRNA methyltransferase first C-terminal domain-containing protein n=1 Tax=Eubacterium aggregans TaxID=81409 RepID=UPI003F3864FF
MDYEAFAKEYLVGQTFDQLYGFGEKLYSLPQWITGDQLAGLRVLRPGLHWGDFKKKPL